MIDDHEPLPRWQDTLALPLIVGVAVAGILFWRDVPLWRSVVIGLTAGGASYFMVRAAGVAPPRWPSTQAGSARFARRNLDWLLSGIESDLKEPARFGMVLRPRLAALAAGSLDRFSMRLDSPAAQQILGVRFHQLLTDPDCMPPHRAEVLDLVTALTALAARHQDDPPAHQSGSATG